MHTHGSIAAEVDALLEAWAWGDRDRILLVLPLNHVHGLVNVTLCALAAGACCEAPGGFDAEATWSRLASGELTLFMAVPTIYARLIAAWEAADEHTRQSWSGRSSPVAFLQQTCAPVARDRKGQGSASRPAGARPRPGSARQHHPVRAGRADASRLARRATALPRTRNPVATRECSSWSR